MTIRAPIVLSRRELPATGLQAGRAGRMLANSCNRHRSEVWKPVFAAVHAAA